MWIILAFASGVVTEWFVKKADAYKDYRIEFLEEAANIEAPHGMYLQKDVYGQVWLIATGSCDQVF